MEDKNEPENKYINITLDRKEIERILKNYIEGLEITNGDTDASQIVVQLKNGDFEDFNDTLFAYVELTF